MSAISDQLPEGGKPPVLKGNAMPSLKEQVKQKALTEEQQPYAYNWTLYLTDGGQCTFQNIISAFQDVYEYISDDIVLDNSLVGNNGTGFHLRHDAEWDGNPKDGFRRAVTLLSGGFPGIHFECWIAEEWRGESQLDARFELPIRIKTNWEWPKEKELWQFIAQRFGKIGYKDSTLVTTFKKDLLKRLENYPEDIQAINNKASES